MAVACQELWVLVMATYYWVGGTGTWDASTTTNWSSSSGGAGGAGFPTSADNVIFDASSGTGTITASASTSSCNNFTWTGGSSLVFSDTYSVFGNVVFNSNINTGGPTMAATTTGKTITTNGFTASTIIFNGVGGGWTLQDNYTSTNSGYLQAGTVNLNGFTLRSPGIFTVGTASTKVLNGPGTLSLGSSLSANAATNFSITGSVFLFVNQTGGTQLFNGGALALNFSQLIIGGAAAYRIVTGSSCNFGRVSNSIVPATLRLSVDITVGELALRGTAGNLVTINSFTAATQRTITQTTGTVNGDYLSITDINATGGAKFYAGANSTNGGNNAGWTFANAPWGQFLSF